MLWNSCNYQNSKPPETIQYQPQPTETIKNSPETIRNYLLHRSPPPLHRATSQQILPCFSTIDFEHDFIIKKVELQKQPPEMFCKKMCS